MCKTRTPPGPAKAEAPRPTRRGKNGGPAGTKDQRVNAKIRTLEDQNEKLAAYAVRVSTEIEQLKRVINKRH